MNQFEKALASYIGEECLGKIQAVKIGIAGAGGLGSNCAVNLVRSGFKNLVIVDFDIIEYTNLNRQFYFGNQVGMAKVDALKENLLLINPGLNIQSLSMKLEESNISGIFSECDVVVEAFDKAIYKKMIAEAYLDSDKLLVTASGLAGWGKSDDIRIHRIKDTFFIVGDLVSDVEKSAPMSPRVNIAAAKQADIILNYVLERK